MEKFLKGGVYKMPERIKSVAIREGSLTRLAARLGEAAVGVRIDLLMQSHGSLSNQRVLVERIRGTQHNQTSSSRGGFGGRPC
ncbi:hypothetical protein HY025_02845 [Candidatus Daviesbacteria bacterium]|nr:hypothetical protein [Candidatus Daviesbacteria bacterium]